MKTLLLFIIFLILLGYAVYTHFQGINAEKNAISNQLYQCQQLGQTDRACQEIIQDLNQPIKLIIKK